MDRLDDKAWRTKRFGFYKTEKLAAWTNLKRSIPRMLDGTDWRNGRKSGFPDCCNVWFHVRLVSMFSWIRLTGNYGFFHMYFKKEDKDQLQHVCCPLHKFLYRNGRGYVYLFCEDCNNMQLNSHTCYKCGGKLVRMSPKSVARFPGVR